MRVQCRAVVEETATVRRQRWVMGVVGGMGLPCSWQRWWYACLCACVAACVAVCVWSGGGGGGWRRIVVVVVELVFSL